MCPSQPDSCAYLFLARSDGSDASKLTPKGNGWGGVHPTWTPVGNRIIYGDNVGENVAGNSTAEFFDPGPSLDIGVRLLAKARPPSSPMPAIMCPPSHVFPSLGPPWRSFLLGRKKGDSAEALRLDQFNFRTPSLIWSRISFHRGSTCCWRSLPDSTASVPVSSGVRHWLSPRHAPVA